MEISETILFRNVCDMLEKIKSAKNTAAKQKCVKKFYDLFVEHRDSFRQQMEMTTADEETGRSSFYSILRCFIPTADSRAPYGLQINTLGKVYIKVLQLADDGRDAERLHSRTNSGVRGDYAEVVHSVLVPRCQRPASELKLKEVHEMLDSIAEDDRRNTEKVLTRLSEIASPKEQKWFIRLLLKTMHLGIAEQRVLSTLHPQASELYKRCSNLSRVCCLLADNKLTVDVEVPPPAGAEMGAAGDRTVALNMHDVIEPFQHIKPMLCEIFPGDIEPLMASDLLYMETKMDGERFQLHYANDRFRFISRNGKDYTSSFGDSFANGRLSSQLDGLLPSGMTSLIIDGEMMVWDAGQRRYRAKGENTDVKHLSGKSSWQSCFMAYDLLYLNGHSLLELPYVQRAYKLRMNLHEREGVLQVMQPKRITSMDEFRCSFQEALDANEEGVVLKKESSVYRPGQRNGGGWYKVKADYIQGLTTEFDLLVMGGFYNRWRTFIESFLLGVIKTGTSAASTSSGHGHCEVYSVGKVANISAHRVVLNETLKPHWQLLASQPPPAWYHYATATPEGRPDVWIAPKDSTVLQIKAADLAPSGAFMLSKSLHFPRVVAWRNDKLWEDALSLAEFEHMIAGQRGIKKIDKRALTTEDITTARKRYKVTPAQQRKEALLVYDKHFQADAVPRVSNFLDGFTFCLLSDVPQAGLRADDLKKLVVANGGTIVENPMYHDPKCIVLAGEVTYRVEVFVKKRRNIVHVDWLRRMCAAQEWKLTPRDMISCDEAMRAEFADRFDKYGDSFTQFTGPVELRDILEAIDEEEANAVQLSDDDIRDLETLLYKRNAPNFFRATCGQFYSGETASQMARLFYRFRGGRVLEAATGNDQTVDYVFINLRRLDRSVFKSWYAQLFRTCKRPVRVVNINWVLHSHKAKRRLDIEEYNCADVL